MNRVGRRTIFAMLLIVAVAIIWNMLGGGSPAYEHAELAGQMIGLTILPVKLVPPDWPLEIVVGHPVATFSNRIFPAVLVLASEMAAVQLLLFCCTFLYEDMFPLVETF